MLELRRRYSSIPSGGSGRLPAGYQEVEYIQGDGNAWIDTGFIATGGMTCEYQGAWIEGEGKSGYIIGSHDTTSPYNRNSLWYHKDSKTWQFAYGDAINLSSLSIDAFQKNTYTFSTLAKDAYAKINNEVVYATYGSNLQPKTSVKIFRIGDFADDILGIIKATLCYAKIWDSNNTLVRHLIPCYRTSDRKPGMYDIVNDVFYTNAGTGEFLVGADVGGGNTDIEYLIAIEVTGGSIITDWIPQAGAVVKWDCMIMDGLTGVIADQRYFDTVPDKDSLGRVFDSNNDGKDGNSVIAWIDYKLGYGAISPWVAAPMRLNTRHTYIWDGLNGQVGYDGNMTKLGNKRTTSSGYPLRLFCGRTSSRMIIYGIELINQENEGGKTYTLRPARKEGIIGLYCEETGVFRSSDDGAEFTIYEE